MHVVVESELLFWQPFKDSIFIVLVLFYSDALHSIYSQQENSLRLIY